MWHFYFDRDIPLFRLDIPFNTIGGDTINIQYKFLDTESSSSPYSESVYEPVVTGPNPGWNLYFNIDIPFFRLDITLNTIEAYCTRWDSNSLRQVPTFPFF